MRFRATIELGGKTATGFAVPDEVVREFGAGKRPAVTVRIGGHTYRSTVAVMAGRSMVPLSAENRAAAGVSAGGEVDVELELDAGPRTVELPTDFAAALAAEPAAQERFTSASCSDRQRRIEKSVAILKSGRVR